MLLPGALLTAIAVHSASDSLERAIGHQLAREAGQTADRLSSVLRGERQTLSSFARQDLMREVRVADIDKRVSVALATLRDGSPMRRHYLVVDAARQVVAASDPHLLGAPQGWLEAGLGRGACCFLQGETLVMTTPIPDPDGPRREVGILVGVLDWARVTAATDQVRRDLGAQGLAADVLVHDADGRALGGARDPAAGRESGERTAGIAALASAMAGADPDWAVHEGADLIVGRASLARDLPSPFAEWKLLVAESRAHALAPAQRLSRRLLATMGLVLLLALAAAATAARRVVRPLSELTGAIRGLAHGDADARRVPVRGDDELGALAFAFNQMADDLERAQHELVEAEKFAFVGELAAGVAHEIRTSLGVLRSSAQILERSLPPDADHRAGELAQMIGAEVGRLSGVVDDLLTLDRARPLRLESVPVSEPVFRALDFVLPEAREKGIELVRRTAPDEPHVRCEPELVKQVAVNLLVNALHALARGGRVEVRILEARDGLGGFEVRDDGPGIPEAIRERIFQPFVSARHGGVGLGLTFVKRVVHEHRGRVGVESAPGRGATFRVELPLADGGPGASGRGRP